MLSDDLKKYKIVLASRSPRRQQLLRDTGVEFSVVEMDFDETYPEEMKGAQIAAYISKRKSQAVSSLIRKNEIFITADTVVWCNNRVLGKPAGMEDTLGMLKEISGTTHEVITGVSIVSKLKEVTFTDITKVTFETLTEEEIRYYAANFNPVDKAGAYGIQEWIGLIGCSRIEGSYFNVVGLPVQKLYMELGKFLDTTA